MVLEAGRLEIRSVAVALVLPAALAIQVDHLDLIPITPEMAVEGLHPRLAVAAEVVGPQLALVSVALQVLVMDLEAVEAVVPMVQLATLAVLAELVLRASSSSSGKGKT